MKKDLLTIKDLEQSDIENILERAKFIKNKYINGKVYQPLKNKTLGMLFNKLSTRTRISFQVGMLKLGGYALFLNGQDIQMDRGETIYDSAKIFSGYLDAILIRTFKHEEIEEFALHADIPVINGLTEKYHPCQILSDIFTINESFNDLTSIKAAYIGDFNNISNSLLLGAAKMGMNLSFACPKGYGPKKEIVSIGEEISKVSGADITFTNSAKEAVKDASIIYTDVWTSMGQDSEYKKRLNDFKDFQVNDVLVKAANKNVQIMHCLPARRGEEITAQVIDSKKSIVFKQAKNRLYVQNAILDLFVG